MGQGISAISREVKPEQLSDLSLELEQSLGYSRFMKTLVCRSTKDGSKVVVKTYSKQPLQRLDQTYQKLLELCDLLLSAPNCLPWIGIHNEDNEDKDNFDMAAITRPYVHTNLYDLLATPPFLTSWERMWIAYQLLRAVTQAHELGVCHGHIKAENVLVSTYQWVLLSDFSPFKPAFLPRDNPAQFSFYCDAVERRSCYLAPERFYDTHESAKSGTVPPPPAPVGPVTPMMDSFSVGCVLAQLWRGSPMFTLRGVLRYMDDPAGYDLLGELAGVPCPVLRGTIIDMLHTDPAQRLGCGAALDRLVGPTGTFPAAFPQLWELLAPLTPLTADHAVLTLAIRRHELCQALEEDLKDGTGDTEGGRPLVDPTPPTPLDAGSADHVRDIFNMQAPGRPQPTHPQSATPPAIIQVDPTDADSTDLCPTPGIIPGVSAAPPDLNPQPEAIDLVAQHVLARLPAALYPATKLQGMETLVGLAQFMTDRAILYRVVPSMAALATDPAPDVAAYALEAIHRVLSCVTAAPPRYAPHLTFPEVVLPGIWALSRSPAPTAQSALCQWLPGIIHQTSRITANSIPSEDLPHALTLQQSFLTRMLDHILRGGAVRPGLKELLGQLATVSTVLADRVLSGELDLLGRTVFIAGAANPALRAAFWRNIRHVVTPFAGDTISSMAPLAAADPSSIVTVAAVRTFAQLVTDQLLPADSIADVAAACAPLIVSPCPWRRCALAGLLRAVLDSPQVTPVDVLMSILPPLRPYLTVDLITPSPGQIIAAALPPLSLTIEQIIIDEEASKLHPDDADLSDADPDMLEPQLAPGHADILPLVRVHLKRRAMISVSERDHTPPRPEPALRPAIHRAARAPLSPAAAYSTTDIFDDDADAAPPIQVSRLRETDALPFQSPASHNTVSHVAAPLAAVPHGFIPVGRIADRLVAHNYSLAAAALRDDGLCVVTVGTSLYPATGQVSPTGEVKVWAVQPMSVSMPPLLCETLPGGDEPTAVALFSDFIVVGTSTGHLRLYSLELGSGTGSLTPVAEAVVAGSMPVIDLTPARVGGAWALFILTAAGNLISFDPATQTVTWQLTTPPTAGLVTSMFVDPSDPSWAAVSTAGGRCLLFDTRFRLPVADLRLGGAGPVLQVAATRAPGADAPTLFMLTRDGVVRAGWDGDSTRWTITGRFTVTVGETPAPPRVITLNGPTPTTPAPPVPKVLTSLTVSQDGEGRDLVFVGGLGALFMVAFDTDADTVVALPAPTPASGPVDGYFDPTPAPTAAIPATLTDSTWGVDTTGARHLVAKVEAGEGGAVASVLFVPAAIPMIISADRCGSVQLFT